MLAPAAGQFIQGLKIKENTFSRVAGVEGVDNSYGA